MKKAILLVAILTMFVGILVAQVKIGVKLGLNMANINSESLPINTDARFGAHLGAIMQYPLIPELLVQPELLFSMKGYSYESSEPEFSQSIKVRYNYLEVPMLLKYNAGIPEMWIQPYIGPSVGFLLSAKAKGEYTSNGDTHSVDEDMKQGMRDIDLGWIIGIDAIYMDNLMIGLRYNHGLFGLTEGIDDSPKNRTFMLSVGYLLDVEF
ncbi:MAG: hypothetical protein CVU48_05895 [Candidatus Cloacimonetes bacterium HGW-Cloacimonetes-1]|nr:MAG: hypothetical protein CVU48_05895 [Candidatus Cloacimonetes bacterium HGW-Cloacimonetes-1]